MDGDTRPVVNGLSQSRIAGPAHDHDATVAALAGDRSGAAQPAQSVVVSVAQGLPGLREQRGEVGPADAGLGSGDLHVARLPAVPGLGAGELSAQGIDATMGEFDLFVENAVRIQIAVALIAYLLPRLAQADQKAVESPLAFARLVRTNLIPTALDIDLFHR